MDFNFFAFTLIDISILGIGIFAWTRLWRAKKALEKRFDAMQEGYDTFRAGHDTLREEQGTLLQKYSALL